MRFDVMPVATEKQIEEIEAIAVSAFQECHKGIYSHEQISYMSEQFHTKEAMKRLMKERQIYYMLLADHELVGYLSFEHQNHHLRLNNLYVKTADRRRGIARKAIEQMDKALSGEEFHHVRKLTINIPRQNTSAAVILQHLGFRITKSIDTQVGGYVLNDYVMERKINRNSGDYHG